jgi:hypothetical protein
MATQFHNLLDTDELGRTALSLLSSFPALATFANYNSNLRQLFASCINENSHPLHATPGIMVRYTAWLGLQGTIAAASLQPYYSAINKFFSDHQQLLVAVCELIADARRGLELL